MFEICESNPFDALSKEANQHEGKYFQNIKKNYSYFLVLTFDSEDDFELV